MYKKFFKRFFDVILSSIGLIVLSPVLLIISLIIKITTNGKIFFLQERLGKNGKVFKIFKFRTMIENAEKIGDGLSIKSENDNRITGIGKFLRKTSLDELPQLLNVLKGDMSLVGPRPPVTYHPHKYEEYPEFQKARFSVRPGITGLAQVELRNDGTWDERINVDLKYIKTISFILDLKIAFQTVLKVVKHESIYSTQNKKKISNERELQNI